MPLGFDDLTDDIQECIKDTFGETLSVTYEPKAGGGPSPVEGVFNDQHTLVDPDTERVIDSNVITLGVKLVDLPAGDPVKGDKVTVAKRGKTYRVHSSQEDGQGWTEIFLHEI